VPERLSATMLPPPSWVNERAVVALRDGTKPRGADWTAVNAGESHQPYRQHQLAIACGSSCVKNSAGTEPLIRK